MRNANKSPKIPYFVMAKPRCQLRIDRLARCIYDLKIVNYEDNEDEKR